MNDMEYETRRMLEDIGLQIERSLRERKVTIRELAEAIQLDPIYLEEVIKGRADVEVRVLTDIGLALGYRWNVKPLQKMVRQA